MIIDASVAFKWLVDEPDADAARSWIGRTSLIAPTLCLAEVGNGLLKRVRKGELASDYALREQIEDLSDLLTIVDETRHVSRAIELGKHFAHPIYDCIYLALAEGMDDELLTADRKFVATVGEHPLATRLVVLE